MSAGQLVLVTGVTGFLGGHIARELFAHGYRIRAIARSAKAPLLKEVYAPFGNKFEVVIEDDLVRGDLTEAVKGVDAVIHAAAPLPSRINSATEALEVAIEGSLNVIRQAERAGVKNFAYVSSAVALNFGDVPPLTDQSWRPVTKEEALKKTDKWDIYVAEKTLAERAVWDFVDQHPHIEMTTVNPPYFYGPFAPEYRNDEATISGLSTNGYLYQLINPTGPAPPVAANIDVRDVAKALVAALKAPPTSQVGRKRIPLSGEWFSGKEAIEYLAKVRPQLKDRLSKVAVNDAGSPRNIIDVTRAKEVLGIEFAHWHEYVPLAIDDLLRLEAEWKAKGVSLH